jgi:branched-subunit amino acid aminotransferase/4-amino-4-deoxychorismate lyase
LERKEAKLMINIVSELNVKNGELIEKKDIEKLLEQDNTNIYEVIRVINKKPVFLKEHFNRMKRSIELSKLNSKLQYSDYKRFIELLIKENNFENCNIRVSYLIKDYEIYLMYFVKSYYPEQEFYEKGIHVVMVNKHRKEPNIKFYESDLRESIDKVLSRKNAFEAILVNDDDTISEGSKSNVFFVKGDSLVTSKDSSVLLGVTREKVIDVCNGNGIKVEKRDIYVSELKFMDAAFITGTSINVLPIKDIDDIVLDSSRNKIVKRASDLYLNEVNLNINQNK